MLEGNGKGCQGFFWEGGVFDSDLTGQV